VATYRWQISAVIMNLAWQRRHSAEPQQPHPAGSGYQIESATGINDNRQIVANADDTATGQTRALLLSPAW